MISEMKVVCIFLGQFISHLDTATVTLFQEYLVKILSRKYHGHWYVNAPHRGSAYRSLVVGGMATDNLIIQCALLAGITDIISILNSQSEITLWVDPNEVSYRTSNDGTVFTVWKASRPSSPTTSTKITTTTTTTTTAASTSPRRYPSSPPSSKAPSSKMINSNSSYRHKVASNLKPQQQKNTQQRPAKANSSGFQVNSHYSGENSSNTRRTSSYSSQLSNDAAFYHGKAFVLERNNRTTAPMITTSARTRAIYSY